MYLHQYLTKYYGNGTKQGALSVDHINQDKFDNRMCNLRIVDASTQNANMGKKNRQEIARPLPEGIQQHELAKYVSYNEEIYNKKENAIRGYFTVEGHPKLIEIGIQRQIAEGLSEPKRNRHHSTKSIYVSARDKLNEANYIIYCLDNDLEIPKKEKIYPVGISISILKTTGKQSFILDHRGVDKRYSKKMTFKNGKSEEENYELFKIEIIKKYPEFEDRFEEDD